MLVTSAGSARPGHFEQLPAQVFDGADGADYFGTLHAIRAVVPSMVGRRRGHLLLVSSTVGLVGVYGYSAYAPAKFAVRGLAETLRAELKPHGIARVVRLPAGHRHARAGPRERDKPEATARISAAVKVRSPVAVAAGDRAGHRARTGSSSPPTRARRCSPGLQGCSARTCARRSTGTCVGAPHRAVGRRRDSVERDG